MTATERDIYHGLARTLRTLARGELALAGLARTKGDRRMELARVRQARKRVREARHWDVLAELGT